MRDLSQVRGFMHPGGVYLCEKVKLIDGMERDKIILLIKRPIIMGLRAKSESSIAR